MLLDFLRSARDLHSLSLVGALGDGWGCLNALVEERPGGSTDRIRMVWVCNRDTPISARGVDWVDWSMKHFFQKHQNCKAFPLHACTPLW